MNKEKGIPPQHEGDLPLTPHEPETRTEEEVMTAVAHRAAQERKRPRRVSIDKTTSTWGLIALGLAAFTGLYKVGMSGVSNSGGQGTGKIEGEALAGWRSDALFVFTDPRRLPDQTGTYSRKNVLDKWDKLYFGDGIDPERADELQLVAFIDEVFDKLATPEGRDELKELNTAYYAGLAKDPNANEDRKEFLGKMALQMGEWIDTYGKICNDSTDNSCYKINARLIRMKVEGADTADIEHLVAAIQYGQSINKESDN